METLLTHVAGVDVHREVLVITVLIGAADEKPKAHYLECRTYTEDLKRCGEQLLSMGVKHVAMESTGVYWKPAYAVWQAMGLSVTVGNAYHLRNVPGRKTDKKDSEWLAELHRNGLIRASYVPDEEFQALRALVRHRSSLVGQISRIKNQAQKVLEDGNVKLGVVLSNVFGVSGLAVLRAIAEGVVDADRLEEKMTTSIKKKILIQAAMGAIKKKDSFYHAKHNQLRFRLGSYNKATVAIANRMARAIYEILKHRDVCFQDLGGQRVDSREKQIQRTLAKLKALGVEVLYDPVKQQVLEKTAAAA